MDMQDKEFDKLFNSKFEDFEAEPSPTVWDNIAGELNGKKGKRALLPWLSIAATIVVLVTAGVLFFKQDGDDNTNKHQHKLTANHAQRIEPVTVKTDTEHTTPAIAATVNTDRSDKKTPATIAQVSTIKKDIYADPVKTDNVIKQPEPVKTDEQPIIAATENHPVIKNVVPDNDSKPVVKTPVVETVTSPPAVIASVTKHDDAPVVKKRGIHNLGGLFNVIIAKVDKRQDKLIEFTDSDDDDAASNVTGVNLGIIKVKKQ
jgi:cytoskeletal protein RodZ